MSQDNGGQGSNRRQFLKATGMAALTSAVAGCQSGSESGGAGNGSGGNAGAGGTSNTTSSPSGNATSSTQSSNGQSVVNLNSYPYGVNETRVGKAKQVMEEAGYGPNNQYTLDWLQYQDPAFKQMANTIRARLESAHIQMNISSANFSSLLKQTRQGKHEAYTLGWAGEYPGPQNWCQIIYPPNTVGNRPDSRIFWSEDAKASNEVRQFMIDQYERIQNNPEDTKEARQIREDAAVKMEEGMWEEAILFPTTHSTTEYMWYDHVDYDPPGTMGNNFAKTSRSVNGLNGKNRYNAMSATFNTLDPVATGSTTSGAKVMDIFDALINYKNGTTEVGSLLAKGYEVNDDFTTYTFTLKEGVQYHNGDEVTASDVEYSIKRLILSENSTNSSSALEILGIQHETNSEGNVVPDSIGVNATGDYTVEIAVESPFAYALEMLATGPFSILPENIVGDVPGYDGEMSYEEFTQNLPGAGPFEFARWESGNGGEVVLDTYQNYHGEVPSYNGVNQAIISGSNARYNYFINKSADLVDRFPTAQYEPSKVTVEETDNRGRELGTYGPLENGETANYAKVPWNNNYYIGFHLEKVPKPVREAMGYVINHEQFVQNIYKGRSIPAFHNMPPLVYPGGPDAYEKHYKGD